MEKKIKANSDIMEITCKEFVEDHQLDSTWRDEHMVGEYERETAVFELADSHMYIISDGVIVSESGSQYQISDPENVTERYLASVEK